LTSEHLRDSLIKYIPEEVIDDCIDWIRAYRITVRIKRTRQSKFGDYHPPVKGQSHKITINHDLNKYAFLITFTHEVAHLLCYNKYGNRPAPHGIEWKKEFKNLLIPLMYKNVFPENIKEALVGYIKDPAASSCTNITLLKALNSYNAAKEGHLHLEDVDEGAVFKTNSGKFFVKGKKLKKNFECIELHKKHKYFIHPLMEVEIVSSV
jgi:SprT protein